MAIPFGKIEKLYIQAYKDAELSQPVGDKFEALINPETYSYKYKIEFCETQAPGTSGVALKFNKIPPQEFNFDFLFDGTGTFKGASLLDASLINPFSANSVADQVEEFKHHVFEYNGEKHRPNHLKIIWGTLIFKGVLIGLDIEYKLFRSDGTPLRVIARCTFKGTVTENLRVARENAQTADVTHERIAAAADKLPLMAYKIYNSQAYYTDVAAANKLDGFRAVKPGTRIFFPPVI
jgi:nucleoid-associated protein YgaU